MKDLDFDELDKAVNSLMSKTATPADAQPHYDANVEEQAPTGVVEIEQSPVDDASPSDQPVADPLVQDDSLASPLEDKEPIATVGNLATKRSGRFIDVASPSSQPPKPLDLRSGSRLQLLSPSNNTDNARSSRSVDGISLPSGVQKKPLLSSPSNPSLSLSPVPLPADTSDSSDSLSATAWPLPTSVASEPLVAMDVSTTSTDTPMSASADEADELSALSRQMHEELMKVAAGENKSSQTPFLPNTKVEKRPLGGSDQAETVVSDHDATGDGGAIGVYADDQSAHASEKHNAPMPAELANDIVAIEAGAIEPETSTIPTPDRTTYKSQPSAAPVSQVINQSPRPQVSTTTALIETHVPTLPAPGSSSISPQYSAQPSSGDAHHSALYDSVSQPLAHPAKRSSGWFVVVAVIVLVLLGAGGAAALYFSHII